MSEESGPPPREPLWSSTFASVEDLALLQGRYQACVDERERLKQEVQRFHEERGQWVAMVETLMRERDSARAALTGPTE